MKTALIKRQYSYNFDLITFSNYSKCILDFDILVTVKYVDIIYRKYKIIVRFSTLLCDFVHKSSILLVPYLTIEFNLIFSSGVSVVQR